ncbi:recombinase XerD [Halovivax sp.]|uniref:tyrosine-type recombinase/integrase n=1 Tax=Halovivax sp. TaxID=1935978 RepID=UPI0025C1F2F0|nr:recombinase XerD [Halovivax sp.]
MIPIADAADRYLERKSVGDSSGSGGGTYASNAASILGRWERWLVDEHDVSSLEELEADHMEAYARELRVRAGRGEYAASTARTYFAVVRAFLSWCEQAELLPENPAESRVAAAALPTVDASDDSTEWSTEARRELESYVRRRANDVDEDHEERLARLREHAMVAVLAHAGVRGGELFRVPEDERRTGATWGDVDFYAGTLRVLGRSRRLEDVALPAAARTPLRRYRVALDPPTTDWPLFPTRHAPSIAATVRSTLRERGLEEPTIEGLLADATAIEVAREHSIAPPAITTEGARTILRRLCDGADVDLDGEYLKPGGARRGLEDDVDRRAATSPQTALREAREQSLVAVEDEPTHDDE